MIGLGTIVNTLAIIVGGMIGMLVGDKLSSSMQDSLMKANGLAVLFIAIQGVMDKINIVSNVTTLMIISLVAGTILGELCKLEDHLEAFGVWLKAKTGSSKDALFVDGFVTASLTVCIGAMAVVGAIQDGIYFNHDTLFAKAMLDFIIIMVMAAALGKGCIFSFVPVFLFQGSITLLAHFIEPYMTTIALNNLSLIGAMLIFCVGVNLIWDKKFKVANMLPALLIAVMFAFF